jgi:hypothetical protein
MGGTKTIRSTGNLFTQTVRRVVLEGRQYVERANPIFLAYRAFRWHGDVRSPGYAEE